MFSPLLRVRVPAVRRAATRALLIGSALAHLAVPASAQQRAVRGDVNGDGRITSADALIVSAHLAGRPVPPTADVPGRGDADGDGRITRADAELILRMVVGKDVSGTPLGEPQLPAGTSALLCRASVRAGTVACEGPQGEIAALHSDRISYGGQNRYVRVATSNVQLDSASEIFSFDLTVQNLLRQAIGTTDGTTVDSTGIRVFFAGDIRAVGGTVEVANADGSATFITGNQPFFRYAELLPQGAVSQPRQWRLRRPLSVTEFSFSLLVSSPVQFAHGWVHVYPGVQEISAGGTAALGDSVFNHVGTHLRDSTIAWSTSDPAVATVSSDGIVSGVADGAATITATQGPRSGSMRITVRTASAATSVFSVARDTLPVRDTSRVTLQLRNAAGVPLTRGGGNVVFSTTLGVLDGVTNNHDGTYTALLTSTSVGTARVSARLNASDVADTATVVFTAGAAASYGVTSSADTVEAGGAVTITAQALDAYGNPVRTPGSVVTWSSTGGGSFVSSTSNTDAAGAATVAFTADSAAGVTHTITATTGSVTGTSGAVVTQAGAAAAILRTTADGGSFVAGGAVTPAPAVRVVDRYGNPVAGVSVTFAVASGGGSATGETQTTDASGAATVGGWTLGTTAGANTLTATAGSLSVTFTMTGTAGAPAAVEKTAGDAGSFAAGSAVTPAPSVTVRDANGNPVPGTSVVFAVASGGGSVTGATQTTDASGVATVGSWTLGTATGANTLTATAGSASATFSATATAGAASSIAKTAGDGQSATAGAAVATAPSVTITDTYGNPIAGVSVTFAASGNGSVTGSPATTDASGVATVGSWTLATTAGANTLTATAGSLTTTFNATGTPGAAANIAKSAGDAQSATAGAAVATAPSVTITDANGNPVPGVSVTFAVASGGGSVTGATQTTDASGVAAVGSWTLGTTAGANTLTATAGSLSATFTATGTAGAPANIAKAAGDAQSATAGAAVATAPSVTITDANGNPVAGVSVTFAASGNGSVTGSPATTDAAGVATAGSWTLATTAGANTLTATAGSLTATFNATGIPGAAAAVQITAGDGGSFAAGTAVTPAPSVRVVDANGNPVPGAAVVFAVASGGGAVTGETQTTDAGGAATVGSWTLGTAAGANTLTATSGAADTTFTVTATAAAPANIAMTAGNAQTDTAGAAVFVAPSVTITDAFGNPVAGVSVTFSPTGNGAVTGSPATTNAAGVATVGSWQLRTTAGPDTLTATAGALTATFTATAVAGAPATMTKSGSDGVSLAAGSAVTPPPAVTIVDANGNPVPGATVTFSITAGGGAATDTMPATGANGVATLGSWTLGTATGTNTLTATAGSLTQTFTITGTVGPASAAGTQITSANPALTAGSITTITVQVTDQYGNALTTGGATVTLSTTLGTLGPVTDAGNGSYTADLTHDGTNGTATVTGTLDGAAIADNAQVTFQSGGIQRTWTGLAGSNWNTAGSWSPRGLPTASDTIVINGGGTQPVIVDADKTILRLVMASSGTLDLGGFTLTVTGDAEAPGGTVRDGTVRLTGSSRTVQGTYPSLLVTGSVAASGNTTATRAVTVTNGTITINNRVLTIKGP